MTGCRSRWIRCRIARQRPGRRMIRNGFMPISIVESINFPSVSDPSSGGGKVARGFACVNPIQNDRVLRAAIPSPSRPVAQQREGLIFQDRPHVLGTGQGEQGRGGRLDGDGTEQVGARGQAAAAGAFEQAIDFRKGRRGGRPGRFGDLLSRCPGGTCRRGGWRAPSFEQDNGTRQRVGASRASRPANSGLILDLGGWIDWRAIRRSRCRLFRGPRGPRRVGPGRSPQRLSGRGAAPSGRPWVVTRKRSCVSMRSARRVQSVMMSSVPPRARDLCAIAAYPAAAGPGNRS